MSTVGEHQFRTHLEASWSTFFDALGITYGYNYGESLVGPAHDAHLYRPAFWLPFENLWVEVSNIPDRARFKRLAYAARYLANAQGGLLLLGNVPNVQAGWCVDHQALRYIPLVPGFTGRRTGTAHPAVAEHYWTASYRFKYQRAYRTWDPGIDLGPEDGLDRYIAGCSPSVFRFDAYVSADGYGEPAANERVAQAYAAARSFPFQVAMQQATIRRLPASASPIEHRFWDAHLRLALPELRELAFQHPVGRYSIDFALPAVKFGIELDGLKNHSTTTDVNNDHLRQQEIELQGWRITRFGGQQVHRDADWCIRRTVEVLREMRG
jgi:very-short-patch-repair endonuclease